MTGFMCKTSLTLSILFLFKEIKVFSFPGIAPLGDLYQSRFIRRFQELKSEEGKRFVLSLKFRVTSSYQIRRLLIPAVAKLAL